MEIIMGSTLSNMECTGLSVGQSKKENNDGVKSYFIAMTLQMYLWAGNTKVQYGKGVRNVVFEEELPQGTFEILRRYKMVNQAGQPILDTKGGTVIDLGKLKASADYEMCKCFLDMPGGAMKSYKFQKGLCYANSADGTRTRNANNDFVERDSCDVLVQVVSYIDGEPQYAPGMSLAARGARIESRFFREAVTPQAQVITVQQPEPEGQVVTMPELEAQQPNPNQAPF